MASERLSWGFSRGAKALAGSRHASDSLTAKAKRALRAAPQVSALLLVSHNMRHANSTGTALWHGSFINNASGINNALA